LRIDDEKGSFGSLFLWGWTDREKGSKGRGSINRKGGSREVEGKNFLLFA
jgi:hypothetical protein